MRRIRTCSLIPKLFFILSIFLYQQFIFTFVLVFFLRMSFGKCLSNYMERSAPPFEEPAEMGGHRVGVAMAKQQIMWLCRLLTMLPACILLLPLHNVCVAFLFQGSRHKFKPHNILYCLRHLPPGF